MFKELSHPSLLCLLDQLVDAIRGYASAHPLPVLFRHVCFGIPIFHALRKPIGTAFRICSGASLSVDLGMAARADCSTDLGVAA
jgi:hypothetical protein